MSDNKPGIEESLSKLEKLLEKMEDEDTTLEQSFALYKEGLKLIKSANEAIDKVEKEIEILDGGI